MSRMRGFAVVLTAGMMLLPGIGNSQIVETSRAKKGASDSASTAARVCGAKKNVAVAERTLIEVIEGGIVQASSQFIRLCIGEPAGFRLPLYFLVGAAADAGGGSATNQQAIATVQNPTGGLLNLNITDSYTAWSHTPNKETCKKEGYEVKAAECTGYSRFMVMYHVGGKYMRGEDSLGVGEVSGVTGYSELGLRFQTAALDMADPNPNNVGILWLQLRGGWAYAGGRRLKQMFGDGTDRGIGNLSIDGGIEIKSRLMLRASYITTIQDLTRAKREQVKFGFDYLPLRNPPAIR